MLLVCLARPELLDVRPGWGGGKLNSTSILLEPLSDVESTSWSRISPVPNSSVGQGRIVEAAEGNPLFVEEMLALGARGRGAGAELVVPPTIQALLAARLDRLGERTARPSSLRRSGQGVLRGINREALSGRRDARRCAPPCGSRAAQGANPAERGSSGGHTFRFRHLLIRDAAYERPKGGRVPQLHEHYARGSSGRPMTA